MTTNYSKVVMKIYHSLLEDSIRLNADTTINDELCQWLLCKETISHSSCIMHPYINDVGKVKCTYFFSTCSYYYQSNLLQPLNLCA